MEVVVIGTTRTRNSKPTRFRQWLQYAMRKEEEAFFFTFASDTREVEQILAWGQGLGRISEGSSGLNPYPTRFSVNTIAFILLFIIYLQTSKRNTWFSPLLR